MNIEDFREHCLSMHGVTEKTPFGKFARRYESILVFYVLDHMFCLVDIDDFSFVEFISTPEEIEEMRLNHFSVEPPMNKVMHDWVRVNFSDNLTSGEIFSFVNRAYEIVCRKYTKN